MDIPGFTQIAEPFHHLHRGQFRKRVCHPADDQGIKLITRLQAADPAEDSAALFCGSVKCSGKGNRLVVFRFVQCLDLGQLHGAGSFPEYTEVMAAGYITAIAQLNACVCQRSR